MGRRGGRGGRHGSARRSGGRGRGEEACEEQEIPIFPLVDRNGKVISREELAAREATAAGGSHREAQTEGSLGGGSDRWVFSDEEVLGDIPEASTVDKGKAQDFPEPQPETLEEGIVFVRIEGQATDNQLDEGVQCSNPRSRFGPTRSSPASEVAERERSRASSSRAGQPQPSAAQTRAPQQATVAGCVGTRALDEGCASPSSAPSSGAWNASRVTQPPMANGGGPRHRVAATGHEDIGPSVADLVAGRARPWTQFGGEVRVRPQEELQFIPPSSKGNKEVTVTFPREIMDEVRKPWDFAISIHFIGKRPFIPHLHRYIKERWKPSGGFEIRPVKDNRLLLVVFYNKADMDVALFKGPHFFNNLLMVIRPWQPGMALDRAMLTSAPIWVSFQNPGWRWTKEALSRLASAIGTPKYFDPRQLTDLEFKEAKVVVEIQATDPYPEVVWVESEGMERIPVKAKYTAKPERCELCKIFGHDCNKKGAPPNTAAAATKGHPVPAPRAPQQGQPDALSDLVVDILKQGSDGPVSTRGRPTQEGATTDGQPSNDAGGRGVEQLLDQPPLEPGFEPATVGADDNVQQEGDKEQSGNCLEGVRGFASVTYGQATARGTPPSASQQAELIIGLAAAGFVPRLEQEDDGDPRSSDSDAASPASSYEEVEEEPFTEYMSSASKKRAKQKLKEEAKRQRLKELAVRMKEKRKAEREKREASKVQRQEQRIKRKQNQGVGD